MSERPAKRPASQRNPRIEALRLVAIAGIAVFHTLSTWFDLALEGTWTPSAPVALALGLVSLLGAFGNHTFFLISGYFLVPRATEASARPGYWRSQARATGRRALVIVLSVALYAVIALVVSTWVVPVSGVSLGETEWLVGGLEFVWVYLVVVALCPVIGWLWRRLPHARALVVVLVACTYVVNAYIAFVSPGSEARSLLEWRKLMSAFTYLVSFVAGGLLATSRLDRAPRALALCAAVTLVVEGAAALAGDLVLMDALSFKSTSLLSFALAACAVAVAARPARGEKRAGHGEKCGDASAHPGEKRDAAPSAPARLACDLTPCILGFYISQSIFSPLWEPVGTQLCQGALGCSEWLLLLVGTLFSLALLALALLVDRIVRIPLLRAARLA